MELLQEMAFAVAGLSPTLGVATLILFSLIEYIFPPFPGDVIVVLAAVKVAVGDWPLVPAFAAVILGSTVGAGLNWWAGDWLRRTPTGSTWLHRLVQKPNIVRNIDKARVLFDRHGAKILMVNRFIPAFRSVFFITAGLVGISLRRTLICAALSATLFNLVLFSLGAVVGFNFETLSMWTTRYFNAALIVVVLILVAFWLRSRFRAN